MNRQRIVLLASVGLVGLGLSGVLCIGCGGEACDAAACDDGNPCTTDACDSTLSCVNEPVNDGDPCNSNGVAGTCSEGACAPAASCPGAGTISGTAVDENDEAIVGMRVAALSPPAGDVTASFFGETDVNGNYSIDVDGNREYRITAQTVVDSRYMTAEGTESVSVACDETASYDIDATRGYFLDATLIDAAPISVGAGQVFAITLSYTIWNRALCEECSPRFIVGIDGEYGNIAELGPGMVHPGLSADDLQVSLTATSTTGSYSLYAVLYPSSRNDDASGAPQEFYESRWPDQQALRYIELGALEVQEP